MLQFKPTVEEKFHENGAHTEAWIAWDRAPIRMYAHRSGKVELLGDTYPVKEQLKEAGFEWDGRKWSMRPMSVDAVVEMLQALDELPMNVQAHEAMTQFKERI